MPNIDPRMMDRLAGVFVDTWLREGKEAAGNYALRHIPKDLYADLRPLIQAKFKARGRPIQPSPTSL